MKKFQTIILLTTLLAVLLVPGQVSAGTSAAEPKINKGHLHRIKSRMFNTFLTGKPSDQAVEDILGLLEVDGSFSDIDYETEVFNSGGKKLKHLTYTTTLARAYAFNPGKYNKSREVYDAISRALQFWVDKNIEDQNWWQRVIGFPKTMMVAMTLVGDDMRRFDKKRYDKCVEYMLATWADPKRRMMGGANGTDVCKFTFATAAFSLDAPLLKEVVDQVGNLIVIASGSKDEGIQPDYSFTQHNSNGRQLYLATYGREYLDGIIYFMEFVAGTDFELAPEKVAIFEKLFLETVSWAWYKGEIDANQYGRGLEQNGNGKSFVELTKRVVALNTPRNAELKQMLAAMNGSGELNGNRMYPRSDYMIHRPKGAMISTRMTSTRTVGNEAGNGAGLNNYHTGDGVNYIKVHGDEYEGVYAGWNWKRIPGTTVMADTREMPAPMWGKLGEGGNDYAGGVSDGTHGGSAFIYAKDSLKAHKSWFYFDNYFVALGAGIESLRADAPAVTTVNQTKFTSKTAASQGGEVSRALSAFDRLWHYDVGYRFEEGTVPKAEVYNSVYRAEYKKNKVKEIFWIGVDHGVMPQGGSYAYAVYPNIGQNDFLARGEDYRILSNTAKIQAVLDVATSKIIAAFYEPGSLDAGELGAISVDQPCLVIVESDRAKIIATVGSPFCESRPLEQVNLQVGQKQAVAQIKLMGGTAEL